MHAHADHSANGEVRTGEQDQPCHAEREEHSRGRLLEDVQHVVDGEKGDALDDRRDDAQSNENHDDRDVQAVAQEEITAVEGVAVILPPLRHSLPGRELRHAQHIDQVIPVIKRGVLPVLDALEGLGPLHFSRQTDGSYGRTFRP